MVFLFKLLSQCFGLRQDDYTQFDKKEYPSLARLES